MTLLPVVHVRAHGPLLAMIAMLLDKPVVDALGRVPLLGRRVPVSLQPGVNHLHDAPDHWARAWALLAIPAWAGPGFRQRPTDHPPFMELLARDRPHALVLPVVSASDLLA